MAVKKYTQAQQVIDTLRAHGGYATLGNLYHLVDTSTWATKTPNESIRRIVQQSEEIFRIQPGLWALEECRDEVMRKFEIKTEAAKNDEHFTLVEPNYIYCLCPSNKRNIRKIRNLNC